MGENLIGLYWLVHLFGDPEPALPGLKLMAAEAPPDEQDSKMLLIASYFLKT